jgi:hypothetical protein
LVEGAQLEGVVEQVDSLKGDLEVLVIDLTEFNQRVFTEEVVVLSGAVLEAELVGLGKDGRVNYGRGILRGLLYLRHRDK